MNKMCYDALREAYYAERPVFPEAMSVSISRSEYRESTSVWLAKWWSGAAFYFMV